MGLSNLQGRFLLIANGHVEAISNAKDEIDNEALSPMMLAKNLGPCYYVVDLILRV